eukprot:scaffold7657_cov115-Skeletonema_dohrnii-CCMP3373.AAC.5
MLVEKLISKFGQQEYPRYPMGPHRDTLGHSGTILAIICDCPYITDIVHVTEAYASYAEGRTPVSVLSRHPYVLCGESEVRR